MQHQYVIMTWRVKGNVNRKKIIFSSVIVRMVLKPINNILLTAALIFSIYSRDHKNAPI